MTTTPHRQAGEVVHLTAPDGGAGTLLPLIALLATRGPVRVLDAGGRFNVFRLAHYVRYWTPDQHPVLDRILVARIFSAQKAVTQFQKTPEGPEPLVILGLLSAFNEHKMRTQDAFRYLLATLEELERVRQSRPVFLGVTPQPADSDRRGMQSLVYQRATSYFHQGLDDPPLPPESLLKEPPVPRNAPTGTDLLRDADSILGPFIAAIRPESREAIRKLIGQAKKYTDAIDELNYINPFEAAQLAMQLELFMALSKLMGHYENQQDTIEFMRERIKALEEQLDGLPDA